MYLHDAVKHGDATRLESLLSTGKHNIDECDEDGLTALQQACFLGKLELVKILVNNGANVNSSKHKQKYTALMFAAICGKLDVISYLLSCGASVSETNCLHRTASMMAAFVGNYFAVALINTYIKKEEISYFYTISKKSVSDFPHTLIDPVHHLVNRVNFSPIKVFLFLSSPSGEPLIQNWKLAVNVLTKLSNKYFTPHLTHEALALKLHILSSSVQRAGEFYNSRCIVTKEETKSILESLIKAFVRGVDPHGLPSGQEKFLRQSLVNYPHSKSFMYIQIVQKMSTLKLGTSPTALSILENYINGFSPFTRSSSSRSCDTEPCATCSDMGGGGSEVIVKRCSHCQEVAYCSVDCQRLHWFTHKNYCPILKKHHDSVLNKNSHLNSSAKVPPTNSELSSVPSSGSIPSVV